MSSLYARGNAIIPFTPSASQEDKEGYLVDLAGDTATISASASVPAKGVILEGQKTDGVSSIGILGGLAAPVRLRAGGTIAKGARVVVVATAHGLKFTEFKCAVAEDKVEGATLGSRSAPLEVADRYDAVKDAALGKNERA